MFVCGYLAYYTEKGIILNIYFVLMVLSILICGLYGIFVYNKIPAYKNIIYWHAGIFLVNITTWYWAPIVLLYNSCDISSGYCTAGVFILISSITLTFLDMILSPDAKYFNIFQHVEETSRFLARVKETKPSIIINLKCYHNESISRQTGFRTKSLYRELITYTDSKIFPFDTFVDQTIIPNNIDIISSKITLFYITKKVTVGDLYSQEQFTKFKNLYTEANKHRDQFTRLEVEAEVPGISEKDRMIMGLFRLDGNRVMTVNGPRPWWTKQKWFHILSCLSISIFQRILFRAQSKEFPLVVTKTFFVDPNIIRTYDFNSEVVPAMPDSYEVPPDQGDEQLQYPAGAYLLPQQLGPAPQLFQHGEVVYAAVPLQGQFGHQLPQENQPFINTQEISDEPPSYSEHHNYKTVK